MSHCGRLEEFEGGTCKVHDKHDIETVVMKQYAPDDVSRDVIARMAQVAVVIHRRTTGVP